MGPLNITTKFCTGLLREGDGKDLGMALEFKSEIKFSFDIFKDTKIGILIVIFQIMTGELKILVLIIKQFHFQKLFN